MADDKTKWHARPEAVSQERRQAYSDGIKALAAIVNVHTPDNLFDLDAIPRDPVMQQVQNLRDVLDRMRRFTEAAPQGGDDLLEANAALVDEIREIVGLKGKPGSVLAAVRALAAPTPPEDAPPAAAEVHEPVAWRLRVGDSDIWSCCVSEWQVDFYGKQSGLKYQKQPLYTTPPAAAGMAAHIATLTAQLAECRGDARRYRWLRGLDGACDAAACVNFNTGFDWIERHGAELDASIDAAIAAGERG